MGQSIGSNMFLAATQVFFSFKRVVLKYSAHTRLYHIFVIFTLLPVFVHFLLLCCCCWSRCCLIWVLLRRCQCRCCVLLQLGLDVLECVIVEHWHHLAHVLHHLRIQEIGGDE